MEIANTLRRIAKHFNFIRKVTKKKLYYKTSQHYYKTQQLFYYKMSQYFITKRGRYYKLSGLLQNAAQHQAIFKWKY